MDLNKELLHLRKLMEEGKIKLLTSMAEPLRNIKRNPDGTVVEDTVSGSVRALLLAIKAAEDDEVENLFLEKLNKRINVKSKVKILSSQIMKYVSS